MLDYLEVASGVIAPERYGYNTVIKYVSWDNAPELCVPTPFHRIGTVCVIVPPTLPDWCRMAPHDSWAELRDRILEGWEEASFFELDLKFIDLETLLDLTKCQWTDDLISTGDNNWSKWTDWAMKFDDAWGEMPDKIQELFESAVPHMPPYASRERLLKHIAKNNLSSYPIGNRVMPNLVEVLKLMLSKAEVLESSGGKVNESLRGKPVGPAGNF